VHVAAGSDDRERGGARRDRGERERNTRSREREGPGRSFHLQMCCWIRAESYAASAVEGRAPPCGVTGTCGREICGGFEPEGACFAGGGDSAQREPVSWVAVIRARGHPFPGWR